MQLVILSRALCMHFVQQVAPIRRHLSRDLKGLGTGEGTGEGTGPARTAGQSVP